ATLFRLKRGQILYGVPIERSGTERRCFVNRRFGAFVAARSNQQTNRETAKLLPGAAFGGPRRNDTSGKTGLKGHSEPFIYWFRKIFSIVFPFANSSINLSR